MIKVLLVDYLEFITIERFGRTRLLKLTQKFFDYFDIVEDNLKEKLGGSEDREFKDEKDQ